MAKISIFCTPNYIHIRHYIHMRASPVRVGGSAPHINEAFHLEEASPLLREEEEGRTLCCRVIVYFCCYVIVMGDVVWQELFRAASSY